MTSADKFYRFQCAAPECPFTDFSRIVAQHHADRKGHEVRDMESAETLTPKPDYAAQDIASARASVTIDRDTLTHLVEAASWGVSDGPQSVTTGEHQQALQRAEEALR